MPQPILDLKPKLAVEVREERRVYSGKPQKEQRCRNSGAELDKGARCDLNAQEA